MEAINRGYMGAQDFSSISSADTQEEIKAYLYWLLEEVAEFMDSFHQEIYNNEAMLDEVADMLGFITTISNLLGMEDSEIHLEGLHIERLEGYIGVIPMNYIVSRDTREISSKCGEILRKVGMLGNILKNRKWKRQNYVVDRAIFNKALGEAYRSVVIAIFSLGIPLESVILAMERKLKVNSTRITSNY